MTFEQKGSIPIPRDSLSVSFFCSTHSIELLTRYPFATIFQVSIDPFLLVPRRLRLLHLLPLPLPPHSSARSLLYPFCRSRSTWDLKALSLLRLRPFFSYQVLHSNQARVRRRYCRHYFWSHSFRPVGDRVCV